jgi:hypothetical protein
VQPEKEVIFDDIAVLLAELIASSFRFGCETFDSLRNLPQATFQTDTRAIRKLGGTWTIYGNFRQLEIRRHTVFAKEAGRKGD